MCNDIYHEEHTCSDFNAITRSFWREKSYFVSQINALVYPTGVDGARGKLSQFNLIRRVIVRIQDYLRHVMQRHALTFSGLLF